MRTSGTTAVRRRDMHGILVGTLCAALLTLTGCGRENPAEAIVDAQGDANGQPVPQARQELRSASAEGAYEVAVAQAEGAHKVAVERCDALSGDQRRNCRDRADAELQQAKNRAQQARDGRS